MAQHNDNGKRAEAIARDFLIEKGYQILEENWRMARAEVDLIAIHQDTLVFVEVKARSGVGFGFPEGFVDEKKQTLLSQAAEEYIFLTNHSGDARFDIIAILFKKDFEQYDIKHIEDAFWNY